MGLLTGTVLVIFILTCLFLILLVMIQTGKGGMGGMFGGGGSQSPFGSGTADIMTTTTKYTAITFMILSLALSWLFAKKQEIISPDIDSSATFQPVEEQNDGAGEKGIPGESSP